MCKFVESTRQFPTFVRPTFAAYDKTDMQTKHDYCNPRLEGLSLPHLVAPLVLWDDLKRIRRDPGTIAGRRQVVTALKQQYGCAECGAKEPPLDFHHIDMDPKFDSPARLYNDWDLLVEEIAKCIILCRKCHLRFHRIERSRSIQEREQWIEEELAKIESE